MKKNSTMSKTISIEIAWAWFASFLGCIAFNAIIDSKVRLILLAIISVFYLLQLGIIFYLDKKHEQKANKLNIVLSTIYLIVGIVSYFYIQKAYIYWIFYVVFLLSAYCTYIERKKTVDWRQATDVLKFNLCALSNALINALSINLL